MILLGPAVCQTQDHLLESSLYRVFCREQVMQTNPRLLILLAVALSSSFTAGNRAFGQNGAPMPGSLAMPESSSVAAPVPGASESASARKLSAYKQLPLGIADAQARIAELNSQVQSSNNPATQESVYQMCEWLADMAEAHQRLSNSFAKSEPTKAQSEAEHLAAGKFSQLKNQALLLKAQLLIKQSRYPEALNPLVDIVVAEPRSATGQQAYKLLKEIGFSQEPELKSGEKINSASPVAVAAKVSEPAKPAVKPAAPQLSKPKTHPAATDAGRDPGHSLHRSAAKIKHLSSAHKPKISISGSPFGGDNKQ